MLNLISKINQAIKENKFKFHVAYEGSIHGCGTLDFNLLPNVPLHEKFEKIAPKLEKPQYSNTAFIFEFKDEIIDGYGFSIGRDCFHTLCLLLNKDTAIDIPQNLQKFDDSYKEVYLNIWFNKEKGWITDCWLDNRKIPLTVPKRLSVIFDLDEKVIKLGPYTSVKMGVGEIKMIECLYNNRGKACYERLETYIRGENPDPQDQTRNIRANRSYIKRKLVELFKKFQATVM